MPSSPDKSKVDTGGNSARLTIPKPIFQAMKMRKGQTVKWIIKSPNKIELQILND